MLKRIFLNFREKLNLKHKRILSMTIQTKLPNSICSLLKITSVDNENDH